jgi:type II secretory pathway component HofQ
MADSVAEVLKITTGKNVEISDAFRLGGRFVTGKVWPVLVKLKSAWDRRLVVIGANKLAQCEEFKRIYVSPDEPLDVRRKATLERLKKRAERERKTVNISNGVLIIDDEVVFSLNEGFGKKPVAEGRSAPNSSQ